MWRGDFALDPVRLFVGYEPEVPVPQFGCLVVVCLPVLAWRVTPRPRAGGLGSLTSIRRDSQARGHSYNARHGSIYAAASWYGRMVPILPFGRRAPPRAPGGSFHLRRRVAQVPHSPTVHFPHLLGF